jgi:hypothetical protein
VRDRLRFGLERLVLRGLRYRLLLAAATVQAVALVTRGLVSGAAGVVLLEVLGQ